MNLQFTVRVKFCDCVEPVFVAVQVKTPVSSVITSSTVRFEVTTMKPSVSVKEISDTLSLIGDQVMDGWGTPLAVQLNKAVSPTSSSASTSSTGSVSVTAAEETTTHNKKKTTLSLCTLQL